MTAFALVEAVEALTEKGYCVLTAEQAEEAAALLGALAFEQTTLMLRRRAKNLLAEWPSSEQP